MAKTKARAHTPKPIPAMLEGSFGSVVENRIAEMNNQLAREGRLTNDPLAVALRNMRLSLRDAGFTFDRVPPGATVTPAAPVAPKAAAPKAPAKTAAAPKATATPKAAAPAATKKARKIKEEQLAELQVAGTVSEAAPYGTDAEGRPLAPYGVKQDGVPMKRRGRVKETPVAPTPKAKAAPVAAAPESSEDEGDESEDDTEVAEATAALTSEEDETESADDTEEATSDDLDDLLDGL